MIALTAQTNLTRAGNRVTNISKASGELCTVADEDVTAARERLRAAGYKMSRSGVRRLLERQLLTESTPVLTYQSRHSGESLPVDPAAEQIAARLSGVVR